MAAGDPFDFDFNFDSEGKLVRTEQTPHGVRQRRNIIITDANGNEVLPAQVNVGFGGRAGGPAFSGGLGGGAGGLTIAAPADLVDKINLVTSKIKFYKQKIKRMNARQSQHQEEFLKLAARVDELQRELDEERDHNAEDGRVNAGRRAKLVDGGKRRDNPNRQRRDATRQLYTGFDLLEAEGDMEDVKNMSWTQRLAREIKIFLTGLLPLTKDCIQVESRYGSSVYSYFAFFRWLVLQSILASFIALGFFLVHLSKGSYSLTATVGSYMPEVLAVSSFVKDEAIDYAAILLLTNVLLIIVAFRKWIKEDLNGKVATMFDEEDEDDDDHDKLEKERKKQKFAKLLLNAWDHTRLDTADLKQAIGQNLLLIQHEDTMLEQMTKRSFRERVKLYTRRVVGLVLSLGLLGLAAYVIILLTITSSELEQQLAETAFSAFATFIVPVAVTLLNAFQPPIIIKLAKFEQWDDPGRQVKYTVWRLFIAKLLNVLLQVASFSMLADPVLLRGRSFGIEDKTLMREIRASVMKQFVPATNANTSGYTCRADQAGLGLFQLVVAEFVFSKILSVFFPYLFRFIAYAKQRIFRCLGKNASHYVKPQFDVAKKMVNLLYFAQLSLMALPLNPFGAVANCFFFFINFKFEKWILGKYYVKPVKPWSAKDAGAFFVKFYLLSLVVALLGVSMAFTNKTFPKDCTVYDTMVTSNYDGVDPYCDHVAAVNTELQTTTVAKDRQLLVADLGGEIQYWLSDVCPQQCVSTVGDSLAVCTTRCENIENIQLVCDTTASVDGSGVMTSGSLSEPCDFQCGPFATYDNAFESVGEFFTSGRGTFNLARLAYVAVQEAAVLWVICLMLLVFACFKWNSLVSVKAAAQERQRGLENLATRLKKKTEKQAKQITALKRAHDEADV